MVLVFCQNTNRLKIVAETFLLVKGGPSSSGFIVIRHDEIVFNTQ